MKEEQNCWNKFSVSHTRTTIRAFGKSGYLRRSPSDQSAPWKESTLDSRYRGNDNDTCDEDNVMHCYENLDTNPLHTRHTRTRGCPRFLLK